MRKKLSIRWAILAILLGALIGTVFGQVIGLILPDGIVKEFFLRSAVFGFSPTTVNLVILTFTLGMTFKLNIIGVIGILLAAHIFRWYV
jgi:hypothetical protein